jgi:REP element-mobilizing transposase RayT
MTSIRHHNIYIDGAACFWTSTVVEFVPILRSRIVAQMLLDIWDENRKRYRVKIIGYVIMPNHLHIIVWAEESQRVRRFLEQSLRRSSRQIGKLVEQAAERGDARATGWLRVFRSHAGSGAKLAVWKERGRAFPVTLDDGLVQKLKYIHENPVRKGLVEKAEDWEFSSASWYADGSGPLAIDSVDD